MTLPITATILSDKFDARPLHGTGQIRLENLETHLTPETGSLLAGAVRLWASHNAQAARQMPAQGIPLDYSKAVPAFPDYRATKQARAVENKIQFELDPTHVSAQLLN